MRQLSLALMLYHDEKQSLPAGHRSRLNLDRMPFTGWTLSVLPHLGHGSLADRAAIAFRFEPYPFVNPPHVGMSTVIDCFLCPSDARVTQPQIAQRSRYMVAFTCFLGVSGTEFKKKDGVLYRDSQLSLSDISDGSSSTLLMGERPPSPDFQFGWWYAGKGLPDSGSAEMTMHVRETNPRIEGPARDCDIGPYSFKQSNGIIDPCSMFHFWSLHPGGANFAMCDGSVHFLSYSADKILPALASRAGNEAVELPR